MTHSLTGEGHDASEDGTGRGTPIVATQTVYSIIEAGEPNAPYNALRAGDGDGDGDGGSSRQSLIAVERHAETVVRRLTELECERLQGYPDGWTEGQTGSARYRQLGNSVAVPVVEWIAQRLVAVDAAS